MPDPSIRYATMPDLATAQALSASAWSAMRCSPQPSCDAAQITRFVYPIIKLTDGRYAIIIKLGDFFVGEHLTLQNGKSFNLTAGQISSLATRAGMGTLLPDILPVALLNSRVTAPQLTAINAYGNTHPTFKANFTLLTSGAIDLQGTLIWSVMNELITAGILTQGNVLVITASAPTS